MAEIQIRYRNWSGKRQVAISDEIPAAFLLGWDLIEHVKSAFKVTGSMRKQLTIPEGKIDSLTSDSIQGCPV